MGKGSQLLLLLWKNWTLQKRQVTRTVLQIILPLLFIAILVLLRVFRIKDENMPVKNYSPFSINEIPQGIKITKFAYAPNSPSVTKVMNDVVQKLSRLNISGFKDEKAMVNSLSNAEDYLGGVYFVTSPSAKDIVYKLRLSSKSQNTPKTKDGRQQPGSASTSWMTQFVFPVFQLPGPRNKNSSYGGPPDYYHEGFLTLQHAIDSALIGIDSTDRVSVDMRRFPYPKYVDDKFVIIIQQSLPLLLMLSLVFTALSIVRDIVYEKERKLKESMKMMGLNGWLHWSAWFIKHFIFLSITMAIATVFFTVKFNSHGKVLNHSDPSVLFVFLLLYSISSIMFCFCVSTFFSKANIAAAAGGIIWFVSYTPYFFVSQSYDSMSLGEKLASCLLSNVAMSMGSQLIGKLEGSGTGMQWSNLQETSVDDSFVFGHVLLMFVVDSVLYGLIAWYMEAVFPGEFGVPQPWYFPVLPRYWCGKGKEYSDEYVIIGNGEATMGESTDCLEKDPVGLRAGIEVDKIKKVFSTERGKKVAVDDVSLNLYEGQITVLLGHNGAGKTTLMSMLTGLFPSSGGTATVNGYSISDNIEGVRKSLGLCPQHDVLFDTLTVEEHLWFFAKLKGCPAWKVAREVQEMLRCIGLLDKASTQTRYLSGGMKRKLSVGIALIGDSKVVMLDEPTSGMDPSARRFTWDLLQQQRQGRTILLTTHYMDEADLLGDRIAIMAEGRIVCCGSSLFLKNKYGVGYHMVIVKEPSCDVPKVSKVIQSIVPTAKMESNVGAELSFVLPRDATGRFEELFTELERQRSMLGVASYGVSVTTMEEVFLKVGEQIDTTLPEKLTRDDSTVNHFSDAKVPSTQNGSLARLGTFGSSNGCSYGTFGCYTNYSHTSGVKLRCQRWYAMFLKRMLHSKRHRLSIISQLLLPLFFMLIALINAKTFPAPGDSPPLNLTTEPFGRNKVPFWAPGNKSSRAAILANHYQKQWAGTDTSSMNVSEELNKYLTDEPMKVGTGEFNQRDLIGASFIQNNNDVKATAWFNNQAYHSIAVALAALENALLKSVHGDNRSVTTINHPLPRTVKESINDLSRNGVGFLLSFNMLFGMAFLASSFVVFLVQERTNKAKHVQFVSGVDPISYWTSAYLWDMINFLLPALSILVLLAAFDVPAYSGERLGYTFLLLMLYGWAIIPLMYLFSFLFRTASTAFVVLTIFNILTGLATLLTVFILSIPQLDLLDVADALKWAFLVLPNYNLGQGMNDIFLNYGSISLFNQEVDMCLESPLCKMRPTECNRAFCEKFIRGIVNGTFEFQENYLSWYNPGIGRYLVFLSWQGVFFFLLVLLLEYRVCRRIQAALGLCRSRAPQTRFQRQTSLTEDDDVLEEKERVLGNMPSQDVLVIKDLGKVYKSRIGREPVVAVDGLSLGVPLSECFGLLGINGAGKTTTFRMLTGDETMTSGTAVVDGFDITQDMNKVRQRVGYCPQFDALIEQMTGRELLYMYARLRGVPEASIKGVVNNIIQALLLEEHADKVSKSYSGGNKRKLSTAISLVGDPPVVFLDEPTTGMDPVARRLLWDALSRVRAEGRCIVITSHSMEECEALCTRLAIMVNGRFKCLGSPQHLKNKFGQGYTLLARVGGAQPDTESLKQYIESSFAGSVLKDEHQGMVHYHIRDTRISWAQLFGSIEQVKLRFNIEDYCVSQTTLEQVFLNFARAQRQEEVIFG